MITEGALLSEGRTARTSWNCETSTRVCRGFRNIPDSQSGQDIDGDGPSLSSEGRVVAIASTATALTQKTGSSLLEATFAKAMIISLLPYREKGVVWLSEIRCGT